MRSLDDIRADIRALVDDSFAGRIDHKESGWRMAGLRAERDSHPDYPAYIEERKKAIERDKASGAYEKRRAARRARIERLV